MSKLIPIIMSAFDFISYGLIPPLLLLIFKNIYPVSKNHTCTHTVIYVVKTRQRFTFDTVDTTMGLMPTSQRQSRCVRTQSWRRRGSGYKWQKIRNNNYRDPRTSSLKRRRKRVSVNARQILTLLYLMFLQQFDNTLPSLSLYTHKLI